MSTLKITSEYAQSNTGLINYSFSTLCKFQLRYTYNADLYKSNLYYRTAIDSFPTWWFEICRGSRYGASLTGVTNIDYRQNELQRYLVSPGKIEIRRYWTITLGTSLLRAQFASGYFSRSKNALRDYRNHIRMMTVAFDRSKEASKKYFAS